MMRTDLLARRPRAPLAWAVLLALGLAAGCDGPMHGSVVEQPSAAPPLVLTDASGARFELAERRGDLVLLFFGYTHCPDVCPTVLADWARVRRSLGPKAEGVQFVFVSVDPVRDTPAIASAYARQFDRTFVGLSGPSEALDRIKRDWGFAAYPEGDTRSSGYGVAHPAATYLIDRQGRLRLRYAPGVTVEELASDLRQLL